MDRNKPPALTSPWKIGFFVSLLLVTTSIGVGFLITRNFGLSWNWIQYAGGTWTFDKESFLGEMLPLAVLVPLLSLFSYFLITGAVRKYKAYLDSGLDYRNLVLSLENIDDLQNKDKIKTLGNYPELKNFLLKANDRISEREAMLVEKENELNARKKHAVVSEEVRVEVGALVGAISKGPEDGFKEELSLSLPEMKRIEDAIRQHLTQSPAGRASIGNADLSEMMANMRNELQESAKFLRQKFDDIAAEFSANEDGARELEEQLGQLRNAVCTQTRQESGTGAQAGISTVVGSLELLDEASRALELLGEETKGVAINTALQAGSGEGGTIELIKLADGVRDLAAKFNGMAQNYMQIGSQIKNVIQTDVTRDNGAQVSDALTGISSKIALWVERAVVLSSKLKLFHEHYLASITALELKLGGDNRDESYQAVQGLSGDGLSEGQDEIFESAKTASDNFERQGQVNILVDEQNAPGEELPGLEKNEGIFEEEARCSADELFANIPGQESSIPVDDEEKTAAGAHDATPDPAADEAAVELHELDATDPDEMFEEMDVAGEDAGADEPLAAPPPAQRDKSGDLVQSHMNLSGPGKVKEKPASQKFSHDFESHRYEIPTPERTKEQPAVETKPEEQIIDLYELGAVDYQPDSVQHNA